MGSKGCPPWRPRLTPEIVATRLHHSQDTFFRALGAKTFFINSCRIALDIEISNECYF